MSDAHLEEYTIETHTSGDMLIAFLAALSLGGSAWGIGWGLVEGLQFGLEFFEVALPTSGLAFEAVWAAYNAVPVLMGLLVGWITYIRVLKMD